MFSMKPFRLKFIGVILLILFIFSMISFVSYSSVDPPDSRVFPQPETVYNLCGPLGAYLASFFLNLFGIAAFYLFLPLGIGAARLLKGQCFDQILLRTTGLILILIGLSGLFALVGKRIPYYPGPIIGPGGYLGMITTALLSNIVTIFGSIAFLTSLVISGFILSGDRILLQMIRFFFNFQTQTSAPPIEQKDEMNNTVVNNTVIDNIVVNEKSCGVAVRTPVVLRTDLTRSHKSQTKPPEITPNNHTLAGNIVAENTVTGNAAADNTAANNIVTDGILVDDNGDDEDLFPVEEAKIYQFPTTDLLVLPEPFDQEEYLETVHQQAVMLEKAFADFKTQVQVVDIQTGPVISQFELKLAKGLRLNSIQRLSDDLAIAMKVPSVRIVAPIPGKNTVGVELPNKQRQTVRIRNVMELCPDAKEQNNIPIYLGKDVSGQPMVVDLTKLPHLLIAGRTGTGKSVCLNSIIVSILMTRSPEQVRMLMIDPKMVELSPYKTIPHLIHPVVTDMRRAEAILAWAVEKMEERYQLLASAGVRQISEYNKLTEDELRNRMKMIDAPEEEWEEIPKSMPYLVIIADEMADLMMMAAKEVETHIIRLAQKSRAVGIHLVLATQKPTVDIVTGLIKSNLPARIAFGVATRTDSLVVLDRIGAERLLGNGDMLFLQPGTSQLLRGQGTYVSDTEIESIIELIGTDDPDFIEELVDLDFDTDDSAANASNDFNGEDEKIQRDELYQQAVEFIIQQGRGSLSLLQRRFSVGYGRAARMIEFMAEDGVVGPYNGSKPREVVMTLGDWKRKRLTGISKNTSPISKKTSPMLRHAQPETSNELRYRSQYSEPELDETVENYIDDDDDFDMV
ncbi:MAG: DNA translocase FtsK 4TM domain-containing protein [Planctomycetaceae bacterium]|jgi:S-DNA-T family DNA segregation ATPase FtsK/SpoIIIE|nr:DNA translocase FtsK 4TM domain-containing protein [Planctomycetaceae bacterium]